MRVVVAGTFGPIHDGHRALFERALAVGDDGVVVGLTSDAFARSRRTRAVPALADRMRAVRETLTALDRWGRAVEFRVVAGEYDFAVTDRALDALVVSPETLPDAVEVNRRRRMRGYAPLELLVVPLVRAADGERISSTRVVAGEIDGHGTPAS